MSIEIDDLFSHHVRVSEKLEEKIEIKALKTDGTVNKLPKTRRPQREALATAEEQSSLMERVGLPPRPA